MCCTLKSTLSSEELFLEQAFAFDKFPHTLSTIVVKASSEQKKEYMLIIKHDWAVHQFFNWLLRISVGQN